MSTLNTMLNNTDWVKIISFCLKMKYTHTVLALFMFYFVYESWILGYFSDKRRNRIKKHSQEKSQIILPLAVKHKPVSARHAQEIQVKSKSAHSSGLIGRCVDLIEEFVLNDLRHQAMDCLYGCLAAGTNRSEKWRLVRLPQRNRHSIQRCDLYTGISKLPGAIYSEGVDL